MDVERVVVRLMADASIYTHTLDTAQARLIYFSTAVTEAVIRSTIATAASYQKAAVTFELMTGNAKMAKDILDDISQMAVETPFRSQELTKAAKELKAFGFETQDIIPILGTLTDVSAGTETELSRIILAFGQVKNFGRLYGQELRQFINANIPILEYLAKVMNVNTYEVQDLVHAGKVGFPQVAEAFNLMTREGGLFADVAKRINKETVFGQWESLHEQFVRQGRDAALAFFEAFHVKEFLTEISQEIGRADFNNLRHIFDEVHAGAAMVVRGGKEFINTLQTWIFLGRQWVNEHKDLVDRIGVVLLSITAFGVGVRALTITVMLATTAVRLFRSAVIGLQVLTGLTGLFSALISFGTSFGSLLAVLTSPLGLIVVSLGAIILSLNEIGAFHGVGSTFMSSMKTTFGDIRTAWDGIVTAVKNGDIEKAFEVVSKGLDLIWKTLLLSMKAEWNRFITGLTGKFTTGGDVSTGLQLMIVDFRTWLAKQAGGDMEAYRRQQHDLLLKTNNQQSKIREMQLADETANILKPLEEYRKELHRVAMEAKFPDLPENIWRYADEGPKGIKGPLERMQVNPETVLFPMAGVGGWAATLEAPLALQNQISKAAVAVQDYNRTIQLARAGMAKPEDLEKLPDLAKAAKAAAEAADKALGLVNKANELKKQFHPLPNLNAEIMEMVNRLKKTIMDGLTPVEQFSVEYDKLKQAFAGPMPGGAAIAGIGNMAAMAQQHNAPQLLGIINEKERDIGIYLEFEKLRKGLPNLEGKLPPPAMYGSREAQDIINRATTENLSVEQEVLKVLTVSQEYQKQTAELIKAIAESVRKADGKGIIPVNVFGNQAGVR